MVGDATDLNEFGIENGWAYYNDFYINAYSDMTFDISESYNVTGTVRHLTGDSIMSFSLSSRSPNGTADVRIEGLSGEAWYRLQFSGSLANTPSGQSHGETTKNGVIQFMEVSIPNE